MLKTIVLALALVPGSAWITPHGKTYHTHRDCIALRTTTAPTQITTAEAARRGLKLCGICARRKK